jgi:hypothetical protein
MDQVTRHPLQTLKSNENYISRYEDENDTTLMNRPEDLPDRRQ